MKHLLYLSSTLLFLSLTCIPYGLAQNAPSSSPSVTTTQTKISKQPTVHYFLQPANIQGSTTPYGDNLTAGHYIQSNDARLYYEVYGEGTPILVLHGGGVGTPYELGRIIDRLRTNHQVIVLSTRGHGHSEIGHTPITFAQRADDAQTVLHAVTSKAAIVFGFSDGAYTAYALASKYPKAVDRIIAIGAGTLTPGHFEENITWEDLRKIDPEFIAQQESLAPEPNRLPSFFREYMKFWSKATVGVDELSHITCPVLLISGDEDDHAPIATMMQAENLIPNSRLCIVPKAGHTAFLDNDAIVWTAMASFIEADKLTLTPSVKVPFNQQFTFKN